MIMAELTTGPSNEPAVCLVCGILTTQFSLNRGFENKCPTCKNIIGTRRERILICNDCLGKALMYAGKKSVEAENGPAT